MSASFDDLSPHRQISSTPNDECDNDIRGFHMHGVLITFTCAASLDDLAQPFSDDATALQSQSGPISKAWISTGDGYGGFHVFTDRASADGHLGSDLAAGLMATDGFSQFQVQHFDVLDELSAMNGIPLVSA